MRLQPSLVISILKARKNLEMLQNAIQCFQCLLECFYLLLSLFFDTISPSTEDVRLMIDLLSELGQELKFNAEALIIQRWLLSLS